MAGFIIERPEMTENCTLTLQCDDRPGLVAAVASCLAAHNGNIVDAAQFNDGEEQRFFMRVELTLPDETALDRFTAEFARLAASFDATWKLRRNTRQAKVLMLVSKFDHCIGDLLYRRRIGELPMDVVGIVGNHLAQQRHPLSSLPRHPRHQAPTGSPDQGAG